MRIQANKIRVLLAMLALATTAQAEEQSPEPTPKTSFALGADVGAYQGDFTVGATLTSPYFLERMAVRLRGGVAYKSGIPTVGGTDEEWASYLRLNLGVVGLASRPTANTRLYAEGGVFVGGATAALSPQAVFVGGYGVFGFEHFAVPFLTYFIEVGGVGTGKRADNLQGRPYIANGLLVDAGFRFYF